MIEPTKITPFTKFCCTIGNLPASYMVSLSYEEQVLWLCDYLKNTIIPNINTNVEAIQELQDYLLNLDLQDEVNNKLDEMAEDGTLATIINQNIFNELNNKIDFINNNSTLVIGDSYALGVTNESGVFITSWSDYLQNLLGLDNNNYKVIAEAGSGFLRAGTGGHTFLTLLQAEIATISTNSIKNIILCGGYNDNSYNLNDINGAITSFMEYVNQQFPNAHVYIGCIGYRMQINSSGETIRRNLAQVVYPAYANNVATKMLGYTYLNGVENILKSNPTSLMYENNAHPNNNGQKQLAYGIYQAFKTGSCSSYSRNTITVTNENASNITSNIQTQHTPSVFELAISQLIIEFDSETPFTLQPGTNTTIANYQVNNFIGGANHELNVINTFVNIQDSEKGRHVLPCVLMFTNAGEIKLYIWPTNDEGSSYNFTNITKLQFNRSTVVIPELMS